MAMTVTKDMLDATEAACIHAELCTRCAYKIIDEEGNPGLFSEACPEGLRLLVAYCDAYGEGSRVPRYARR